MSAIDFPGNPGSLTPPNYWTAASGVQYKYDGEKWVSTGGSDTYISMGGTAANFVTGDIKFSDTKGVKFGANADLAIYHDGTNNYIDFDTGNLIISIGGTTKLTVDSSGNVWWGPSPHNSVATVQASGVASFTGTVASSSTPTHNNHLTTKAYVDSLITAEDFWSRSGTTISPETANDVVDIAVNYTGTSTSNFSGPVKLLTTKDGIAGLSPLTIDVSELQFKIHNPADDANEGVGIGFGVSATGSNVGAAIVHQRLGSQSYGNLCFATKASGAAAGADLPVRLTIDQDGDATFTGNVSAATPTASGHLATKGYIDNAYVSKVGTVDNGFVSINVENADYIVKDSGDTMTNYIWRDYSASKLYLGTAAAVITTRSNILPDTDSTFTLGSNSSRFSTIFTDNINGRDNFYMQPSSATATCRIEIGGGRTGNGFSYIDFIGDATTYTDYGLRMIRNNDGPNADSVIYHRGTGSLKLITQELNGSIYLRNNGVDTAHFEKTLITFNTTIKTVAGAFGANVTSYGGRNIQANYDINSTSMRGGMLVRNINDYRSETESASFMHYDAYDSSATSYAFRAAEGATLTDTFWVKGNGKAYFAETVGIGTTSADEDLHVHHTGNVITSFKLSNDNVEGFLQAYTDSHFEIRSGTNHPIVFKTNGNNERMRITNDEVNTSGNIIVTKALPKLILDSPNSGDEWTSQGAQISLGESGDGGAAALHLTYTGNGYGYIGMGALSAAGVPSYSMMRFDYNSNDILFDTETRWPDDHRIRLGWDEDFQIHFNNNGHTYFRNYNHAAGNIYFQGENTSGSNKALIYMQCNTSRPYVRLYENSSEKLRTTSAGINVYGDLTATGDVTAYSDIKLKENINTIDNALNKVCMLRGVEFNRKDLEDNPRQIGVIAQEIENIVPEVVASRYERDEDGNETSECTKSVAYGNLTALLIEAVKELKAEIQTLKEGR